MNYLHMYVIKTIQSPLPVLQAVSMLILSELADRMETRQMETSYKCTDI